MSETIHVGIAELKLARPPHTIRTSGLGSCVGVVVYDESSHLASMAHVMLPDSSMSKETRYKPGKYADTAVKALYDTVKKHGNVNQLKAKIAGGAQMFQLRHHHDLLSIGKRNAEAVKRHLQAFQIELIAADIGGNCGRTIEFSLVTFRLSIRKINAGVIEI